MPSIHPVTSVPRQGYYQSLWFSKPRRD